MIDLRIPSAAVRGFNYHPSYSTGSLEDWIMFDYNVWEKELKNGVAYCNNYAYTAVKWQNKIFCNKNCKKSCFFSL